MSTNTTKPVAFINASAANWLQTIGDMVDAKMQMTFRTEVLNDYKIPVFLATPDYEVLQAENKRLREGLQFYANGEHFTQHVPDAWESVSGEPDNFLEDESNTATVEDGSFAKALLAELT